MTALQHYLKEVDKMRDEKGVKIEKTTLNGIISKIESMPADDVQYTACDHRVHGL